MLRSDDRREYPGGGKVHQEPPDTDEQYRQAIYTFDREPVVCLQQNPAGDDP